MLNVALVAAMVPAWFALGPVPASDDADDGEQVEFPWERPEGGGIPPIDLSPP
ncbi:hypothetical protein [Demequina aestuarii]|uniref:hypothetical protein n=1 Tax=Demequina aestuarii TaxID=327095 RepID=UPI000AD8503E|nr:hypothetical protein [Demequina aestuarii]